MRPASRKSRASTKTPRVVALLWGPREKANLHPDRAQCLQRLARLVGRRHEQILAPPTQTSPYRKKPKQGGSLKTVESHDSKSLLLIRHGQVWRAFARAQRC